MPCGKTQIFFFFRISEILFLMISLLFLGEEVDSSKNGEAADENEKKSSLDSLLGEVLEEITRCIFYPTAISSFKCSPIF